MSYPSTELDEEEPDDDGDVAGEEDKVLKWKIDHSSGDHRLNGRLGSVLIDEIELTTLST